MYRNLQKFFFKNIHPISFFGGTTEYFATHTLVVFLRGEMPPRPLQSLVATYFKYILLANAKLTCLSSFNDNDQ